MGIEQWIRDSQENVSKFLSDYCIVNGEFLKLSDIEKWGYHDFIKFVQSRIPKKLYKYFPNIADDNNVNYSLEAIVENTVHLSFPRVFDDIYDSDISMSFELFQQLRLQEYCRRAGIVNVNDDGSEKSTVELTSLLLQVIEKTEGDAVKILNIFHSDLCSEIEKLANELFCRRFYFEISHNKADYSTALYNVLRTEYYKCLESFKNTFKTTCFATTPYSQLMWGGSYGNCHHGLCIEYSVTDDEDFRGIYENLFPLVYSKVRSNIEKDFINQLDSFPSMDTLKDIYIHGALRKSLDWSFQNEWRLLLMDGMPEMDESKVRFFPISKVYMGYRMASEEREKVIMICRAKGIDYATVKKRSDIFEMEEDKSQ